MRTGVAMRPESLRDRLGGAPLRRCWRRPGWTRPAGGVDAERRPVGAPHRASRPSAGDDAASAAQLPGRQVVSETISCSVASVRGMRLRSCVCDPESPGAHHRRPRRAARRRGARRAGGGDDHAHLLGLPRDEHVIAARHRGGAGKGRHRRARACTVLSPAWTTDWMTRGGAAQAARLRRRAHPARRRRPAGPVRRASAWSARAAARSARRC